MQDRALYCQECLRSTGIEASIACTGSLFDSTYQQDKLAKHTSLSPVHPQQPNGVFHSGDTHNIQMITNTVVASGFVEKDHLGRTNFVYQFPSDIGEIHQSGKPIASTPVVKVVLPNEPRKTHPFPCEPDRYLGAKCTNCGRPPE